MTYNQKSQPKNSNSKANSKHTNDPDAELKENIRKFKEVCVDYADDNDELISLILQEFNNNLEDSITGAIMGITKYKSQGSWQKVGGVQKKTKNQNQGNKQYNNNNYKGRNNANKDGKPRGGNPNYKGNPKDNRKNNIQSKPKREPPTKEVQPPSLPEQTPQSEPQKPSDSVLAQAPPNQNQNQNQNAPQPQVFISQPQSKETFVKHENYASAVKRGVQQQLLAKENSKPPNVVPQQAPREEAQSVPANNAPLAANNSNVSQAPPVQPQVPQQQVPQQHQPQHQVAQSHPPPQKNVEPEPIPEQRNVVQQNNAVQLPKTQPKQEVTTVNVGISTKNVILPGGLFEDEQVEIQFGKVNPISDKNVDTIKEQSNQEDNSQDNSQKQQVNPIFPEVNNPSIEGSHYEQDLVPPMIPYPYGLPQNQPYPPYVMDQERGHMPYVDPSYSYPRDGKYNQRNTQYRDNKFQDSSAPNVPQQGNNPQQPTGHPNQHNVYQPFPVFPSHMYGLPYNPPTSGYPYPRFMYYPGYGGTNVNTGMGYPTEEEYKLYSQGMPNYYPDTVPKNQSNKGNQSKNAYQDPSGQPSSGAFKGNQQLNQPTEFKNFRDPNSYYGNINPSQFNYPPNPQAMPNTYQRQQ